MLMYRCSNAITTSHAILLIPLQLFGWILRVTSHRKATLSKSYYTHAIKRSVSLRHIFIYIENVWTGQQLLRLCRLQHTKPLNSEWDAYNERIHICKILTEFLLFMRRWKYKTNTNLDTKPLENNAQFSVHPSILPKFTQIFDVIKPTLN